MYAIFDMAQKQVLKLVRHKPDLTMAIGHGEGPIFVTADLNHVQDIIRGADVWIGGTIYVLEMSFFTTDGSGKDHIRNLKPFKLTVDKTSPIMPKRGIPDANIF
jgi:hypothetical protein